VTLPDLRFDQHEFAFTCHPRRDLALRYAESSAPAPVAPTAQPGKPNRQGELRIG
jgi:putative transposase